MNDDAITGVFVATRQQEDCRGEAAFASIEHFEVPVALLINIFSLFLLSASAFARHLEIMLLLISLCSNRNSVVV
jgi:hypothetical protein